MDTAVLVVGAGPCGLGLALELHRRGTEVVVVGDPFSLWLDHTLSSLRLRSSWRASEICGVRAASSSRHEMRRAGKEASATPSVESYRAYLRRVLATLPFAVERRRVARLEHADGSFRALFAEGGALTARLSVVATGPGPHRYLPPPLATLPRQAVIHTWDARRIEDLAGERVLVVGGGQSAAEAVAHLRHRNEVTWALRREPLFFREPLRVPAPLFRWILALSSHLHRLPPALLRRVGALIFRATILPELLPVYRDLGVRKLRADAASLELHERRGSLVGAGGRRFDRVVAATGFRATTGGLFFLAARLGQRLGEPGAAPVLSRVFETRVSGLFVGGAAAESRFGPVVRFLVGARLAARRLGPELADRVAGGARPPSPSSVARLEWGCHPCAMPVRKHGKIHGSKP